MELNTFERLTLLEVLEGYKGTIDAIKIVRKLREELSFDETEHKSLKLARHELLDEQNNPVGVNYTWDEKKSHVAKDVEVGDVAKDCIVRAFQRVSQNQQFTDQHLAVYEKFAPDGGDPGA